MTKAVELAQVASTGVSEAFKNRIINGAMVIDQRGVTQTNPNPAYVTDRWSAVTYGACTVAQSSTAPTGFTNSLLWTSTTGSSPSAGQWAVMSQAIEGYNVADLGWGASGAQTVTLSFWVRSSLTGTFSVGLGNPTTTSNFPGTQTRSYVSTYTISSANTWEYKTITISGDTSGTWLKTTGVGICVTFDCGSGSTYQTSTLNAWQAGAYWRATGSVSVQGTTSATLLITGVQLEVGSSATSFEYRPYQTELNLCYRYFYSINATALYLVGGSSTLAAGTLMYPVPMRSIATLTGPTIDRITNFGVLDYTGSYTFQPENSSASRSQAAFSYTRASGATFALGTPLAINPTGQVATITASAEL